MTTDLGLFLIRLVLASILFVHATQKWWGWFNGPGLDRMVPVFERLGQQPARLLVRVAALGELVSALLLFTGFLTIYASALASTTMLVAGMAMCLKSRSISAARGGGEYPLVLGALAACAGVLGSGGWSVDSVLGGPLDPHIAWWTVLVCVVTPVLATIPPTLRSRSLLASAPTGEQQ